MGLFDYIKCEYPIDAPEGVEWQTKFSDAPYMETYTITSDGRLIHHTRKYEIVPLEERPFYKPGMTDDDLESFFGCMRGVATGDVEIAYRGEIQFYGTDKNGDWWQYSALFDDGKLINMTGGKENTK